MKRAFYRIGYCISGGGARGFFNNRATLTNGVLTGSFTPSAIRNAGISLDSLLVLMRNGNAYVNVHTTLNPNGELRGQIGVP